MDDTTPSCVRTARPTAALATSHMVWIAAVGKADGITMTWVKPSASNAASACSMVGDE